jgi:hypothetical protein
MIFLKIIVMCRPGIFQASREEHYEDRLLQEVEDETPVCTVSVNTV